MRNYFEWAEPISDDPEERDWSIEFPEWIWVEFTMAEGAPVTDWDPSLIARSGRYGKPVDFRLSVGGEWHIYSERLRLLVEQEVPSAVQYLPFRLRSSVGSREVADYWVANHLRLIDCLDKRRTTLYRSCWEPVNPLGDFPVRHAVLSRHLIASEMLFRVKGDSGLVVVRGDLKERIEAAGMTGCLFTPVDVSE